MKKILIIGAITLGLSIFGVIVSSNNSTNQNPASPSPAIISQSPKPPASPIPTISTQTNSGSVQGTSTTQDNNAGLSNDNYYTNVNGNQVHAPAYSNTVPQGATAQCIDGTYSFSQHRQGTCSHHGGVAQWL